MRANLFSILRTALAYLVLNVGTILMLQLVILYSSFDDHAGFLREKQAYLHLSTWKAAFYVHVFTSILALLAGFTQFSSRILKDHRWLHRLLGRIYAFNILLINFPAGLIMAVYANGHLPTKAAFILLDGLWFGFTLKAVLAAKNGRIPEHRDYMIRSYALTLSAVTLRSWKIILTSLPPLPPPTIYMINAWLGFVPNWLCAEWLIARRKRLNSASKKDADKTCHQDAEAGEANDEGQNAASPGPALTESEKLGVHGS